MIIEQPFEALDLVGVQAQRVERLHRRPGIEDADDDFFALCRGQRRDAQVDRLAAHRHARAAVLRPQPVGDVEGRHDLDA